ncbi:MAG: T9SS type A sorting domain-containing protein [Bacteroidota bacterium]
MKTTFAIILFVFAAISSFCQQPVNTNPLKTSHDLWSMERRQQPGLDYPDYPLLQMTQRSSRVELPAVVDNSEQPYLRPVFSQENSASCEQASTVGYNFCYEMNRLRKVPSNTKTNQYSSHFTWNFMNETATEVNFGVSYFHTFDILHDAGNPTENIYGLPSVNDFYYWMNGYDGYFQGMHNRISGVSSINAGSPEGLIILKHWLFDHLEGASIGGVASFSCGMPYVGELLQTGTPEAGKHVQIEFGQYASHSLTIVGYNDSIRYDVNGDGVFTNNLDITGDGIVDMEDWEIGGLKYVNSYGVEWSDSGFCYMLYRTLALKYGQGGIWNNSVHVLHPDTVADPLLTIKATISYNKRGRIRLQAGIAADTAQYCPANIMSFSSFNFQGGDNYMTGRISSGKTLELGLDITPLLSYVKSGEPFRVFLIIDEKDPDGTGEGLLLNYSAISYLNQEPVEYISQDSPLAVVNNGRTIASVNVSAVVEPIEIQPDGPVVIASGSNKSVQFTATGGYPPYSWILKHNYNETESSWQYNTDIGIILQPTNTTSGYAAVPLPFSFPFCGQRYDTLYMHVNGYLLFDRQDMPYFYLLFDENYLRQVKAIAGYMNHNLAINTAGNYISYISSQDSVVFNWRISDNNGNSTVMFSSTVFPDGRIVHHYGPIEPSVLLPVIGLSDNSKESTYYSHVSGIIPPEDKIISFIPSALPDEITLSEDGTLLILTHGNPFSDKISVLARDSHRIYNEKTFLLTTGPEISVKLPSSRLFLPPGSEVPLEIEVKNLGNEILYGLSLNAMMASENATITGDAVTGIEVLPGQSVVFDDNFSLKISDTLSCPQMARVIVAGTLDNFVFRSFNEFQVDLPVIEVSPPLVADGNNYILEPGEDAPLIFRIFNYGRVSIGQLTIKASIHDPFAGLYGPVTVVTDELKGLSVASAGYKIKVNSAAPLGRILRVGLEIYCNESLLIIKEFNITIGQTPIAVIDKDKNHNSAVHIATAINTLNTSNDRFESIGSELLNYNIAFLSLGWFPNNSRLSTSEDSLLIAFLEKGGSLYLEGGRFYKSDPATMLRERMRVEGSSLAWYTPADTILGKEGTPAEGMQFKYLSDGIKGENLLTLEPAVPWLTDKNSGLVFTVALDSGIYRTIASSLEFGGTFMFDSPDRPEMIMRYLNFLGYNTNPLSANFKADNTSICKGMVVNFEPVCSGNPINFNWIFEGGTPQTWEGPSPVIKYENSGSFRVSLTIDDGISDNTFFLNYMIYVDNCTGVTESNMPVLRVYPNPASEIVRIETKETTGRSAFLTIADISGRIVLSKVIPTGINQIQIPIERVAPGCYIITLSDEKGSGAAKLIVY